MDRLRRGFSLRSVLSGKWTPDGLRVRGIGSLHGFASHCKAFPSWGAEATRLVEINLITANRRKGARKRNLTHCKRGHELSGTNLGIKASGQRWCKACNHGLQKIGSVMKPEQIARVHKAIENGLTVGQITQTRGARRLIVTFKALKRYRIENPSFDRFLIENARVRLSRSQLMLFRIVPSNAEHFRLDLAQEDVPPFEMQAGDFEWILSLLKQKRVPFEARYDVAQDIIVSLLSRAISRENLANRIMDFTSEHYRRNPGLGYGTVKQPDSLDAPIYDDADVSRGDRAHRGLWD
ncbi:hypothetical protein SAMN05444164_0640 [Bradyrhizobium erythrophlei]|uniref:Uncharacterized protein n=2 Tax=Bradyrhizobium erythrophlei TaxID=1437360 RepID=A0A1H4NIS2_9BRAD|nr:hypothetical protein SAMN05444164_0640 [Bradyrhizobium erythrophlei]